MQVLQRKRRPKVQEILQILMPELQQLKLEKPLQVHQQQVVTQQLLLLKQLLLLLKQLLQQLKLVYLVTIEATLVNML